MNYDNLVLEKEGPLAVLTINRPPVNALTIEVFRELEQLLHDLEQEDEVRAIIITGEGKSFIAGADITALQKMDEKEARSLIAAGHDLFNRLETYPKPIIAAVNGLCLGGGCELAMACDLRFAAESARFGQPEINLGVIPGWGGTQRLPRLVGKSRGMEALLTGEMIESARAMEWGLVNRVFPDEQLLEETRKVASRLAKQPPLAVNALKKLVSEGLAGDIRPALQKEQDLFVELLQTEDGQEGVDAFIKKRRPNFKGQ